MSARPATVGGEAPGGPLAIVSQPRNPTRPASKRPRALASTADGVRYATSTPGPQSARVVATPTHSVSLPAPPSRVAAPRAPTCQRVSSPSPPTSVAEPVSTRTSLPGPAGGGLP